MANIVLKEDMHNFVKNLSIAVPKGSKRGRLTITDKNFLCPNYSQYNLLADNNYKVKHLKDICRKYKQKVSGNKDELMFRIYNYLRLSGYCCIIQKKCRNYLIKKYNKARGPGHLKRDICVNKTDFLTMDDLKSLPYNQFISFSDKNNQIYGFNIKSLYIYIKKNPNNATNPYNRQVFPKSLKHNINYILRIAKIIGENIAIKVEQPKPLPIAKQLELRTLTIFQDIDNLGNYTDHHWFNNLGRISLIRFIRELSDIWGYRAQLTSEVKREICPPVGDPFRTLSMFSLPNYSLETLKRNALTIIEHLVRRGINENSRALGANYVLCALTLVSNGAANSLPWLYQSVAQH